MILAVKVALNPNSTNQNVLETSYTSTVRLQVTPGSPMTVKGVNKFMLFGCPIKICTRIILRDVGECEYMLVFCMLYLPDTITKQFRAKYPEKD